MDTVDKEKAVQETLFFTPPESFAIVIEGIYRCASVEFPNLSFLKTLNLRTTLTLTPEKPAKPLQALTSPPFTAELVHTAPIHPSPESWTTYRAQTVRTLRESLRVLMVVDRRPILVVDPGGLFCGVVRRWMGWGYTSCVLEYRAFAGSKARYAYEEFLDHVDVKGLRAPPDEEEEKAMAEIVASSEMEKHRPRIADM